MLNLYLYSLIFREAGVTITICTRFIGTLSQNRRVYGRKITDNLWHVLYCQFTQASDDLILYHPFEKASEGVFNISGNKTPSNILVQNNYISVQN